MSFQVITAGVIVLAYLWYFSSAHHHYIGPQSNLHDKSIHAVQQEKDTLKTDADDKS